MRRMTFVLLLLFFSASPAGQGPSADVVRTASRSVVSVSCRGVSSATGFFWPDPAHVVTALHVVAGCEDILVRFESVKRSSAARVVRLLKAADLALLALDDPPALPAFQPSASSPGAQDELVTLGYGLGAPTMHSVNLRLSYGSSQLEQMLPRKSAEIVRESGIPSLTLRILRLEGHLVPGLSGAPILDREGRVVAIADGGLENGAVAVSWGVPAENLARLAQSSERMATRDIAVRDLFEAESEAEAGETLRCGTMIFTKLRTEDYADLIESADDPAGAGVMRQLAEFVGMDPAELEFDIYSHLPTGATFVAPADTEFTRDGEDCIADFYEGGLQFRVYGSTGMDVIQAAQRFRSRSLLSGGYSWQEAPGASIPPMQKRFDGLDVKRTHLAGRKASASVLDELMGQGPVASGLEVLLGRGDAFLGVVVLATDPDLQDTVAGVQCGLNSNLPGCRMLIAKAETTLELMIAGYLSTFPIG